MPQESVSKYENGIRYEYVYAPGCNPTAYTYQNSRVESYYRKWNEAEHRPYPKDLHASITGQTEQATRTSFALQMRRQVGVFNCPHLLPNGNREHDKGKYYIHTNSISGEPIFGSHDLNMYAQHVREDAEAKRISLGETLAEYRQSARMFGSAAKTVKRAWSVLRKKRRRRRLSPCSVPAAYLQYTYGVAPIVGLLYDSVEHLRLRLEHPIILPINSYAADHEKGDTDYGASEHHVWSSKMSQRVRLKAQFPPNYSHFDLGNPVEWSWELIPFSFVVDWLIPIGRYLGGLDALAGVEKISGTVTTKRKYSAKVYPRDGSGYELVKAGYHTLKTHERQVLNTVPFASLPQWSPSASWTRVRHGLNLLWAINKKCKK